MRAIMQSNSITPLQQQSYSTIRGMSYLRNRYYVILLLAGVPSNERVLIIQVAMDLIIKKVNKEAV